MDEYRPTLLGRALADVLQEMEQDGTLQAADSDALFEIFDDVVRSEFAAAEPQRKTTKQPPADPPVELFTHRSMDLKGTAQSFNRFMDKWTIHAILDAQNGESLRLEGVPIDLQMNHLSTIDMLLKLHDLPKPKVSKRRK